MPFDPSKVKPDPSKPHVVHVQLKIAVHGKTEDGQLHGVASHGPEVIVFELSRANAAIATSLQHEVIEAVRRTLGGFAT